MSEVLKIPAAHAEGRFARFELISWWDQKRLAAARVVVIGAGALGNEILKNLALLGVGQVFVADLDRVENSNLSRSVLFREQDCGRGKAEVACRRMAEIYPAVRAQPFHGNIVYDLGLGVYRWADVILGGLDNREARVAINQAAARTGRVWIDGAIERLDGVARVFDPAHGPCYECTMGENDWKMLAARRSCALLSRDEMEGGKVPTTPTVASVIAGIQCQEAVKLLHGQETIAGQGFIFEGRRHESYRVTYSRRDDCPSHDAHEPVEALPWGVATTTAGQLLEKARLDLGSEAVIEFNQDLLRSLRCQRCDEEQAMFMSLGKVTQRQGKCPCCGEDRIPAMFHAIDGTDRSLLDKTLEEIGVPPWDIVSGRSGLDRRHYELQADRQRVLGTDLSSDFGNTLHEPIHHPT